MIWKLVLTCESGRLSVAKGHWPWWKPCMPRGCDCTESTSEHMTESTDSEGMTESIHSEHTYVYD